MFNRVGLKTLVLVLVIAGIFLAITRNSPPAACLVVLAMFGTLTTLYIRQSNGCVLLCLLIGFSLAVGAILIFLGTG